MNLYSQIGGEPVIGAAVDGFYQRMLADPIVAGWFEGIDLSQLKDHQRAFLVVGLGGPEHYAGRSMRNAHAGLAITNEAYSTALEHLAAALHSVGVDDTIVPKIIKRIETMRHLIVEVR
ncbi:MAG: group 1 truncated hemoglobin [Rhodoglobus sp.]